MNEPAPAVRSRYKPWWVFFGLTLLACGAFSVWYFSRENPSRLLEQALAVMRTNPSLGEQLVRRAIALSNRPYPDAELSLCRILIRKGATEEASQLFQKVDLDACRPDFLLAFGRDALSTDQRTEAHKALESLAGQQEPDGITALELLLSDYQEWGQEEPQLATARKLTELEPQNAQRWSALVNLLIGMSRDLECVEAIREAQRHELPAELHLEFQNHLVQRLINLGDINGVRRELAEMRKFEPDSIRIRGLQAYLYRMEGKLDQALETISSLLQKGPGHPYAHFTRGIIYLDLRRYAEAAQDLERTLAAQPFNSAAEFKLSEAYRGQGQLELADKHRKSATNIADKRKRISTLLKQRQSDPRNPKLYTELAQLHRNLGETNEATKWEQWAAKMKNE